MATSPSPTSMRLAVCGVLLALYVGVVLVATMWPTPLDAGYESAIAHVLDILHRHGVPEWFGYGKLEFTANIAMFVPLGFLLALTLPERGWWAVMLLVPGFSALIEYTQGEFLSARFASGWDVVANTVGGYVGAVLAYLLRALIHARDRMVVARALAGDRSRG
ncbi:VanZ family protein [Propionicimonas sp.]|uniref:VanZ family protein n=1 Tax=Propionicimonas sp. TaxID=1955623 RepID=UPI0039E2E1B1